MTCLSIIQTVYQRLGFTAPNSVASSGDKKILQFLAMSNEEGQNLAKRHQWTALQTEVTFNTVAAEDQGAMATLAPGLKLIINDTIWNRSLRRPVFGPNTPSVWQQKHAFAIAGPWSSFRIKQGHLYMYPVPVAGQACYFEYISRNWATDSTGATGKASWTADDDVPLLDEQLLIAGTIWRWKKMKGFEYADDRAEYEKNVLDAMAQDGGKDWLNMTGAHYDIVPAVLIPTGNWNL